jgi:hypothetical protein
MFFIFGTARSGTTLLAQCLNAHPAIVVPHETDFLVPMAFIQDRVRDPAIGRRLIADLIPNTSAFAASLGEYLDADTVKSIVAAAEYHPGAIANALYAAVAGRAGACLAGDKSPNDLNFVRILVKTGTIGPGTRVIHLVRDIRDVMVSLGETGWGADLEQYFPRQWSNSNLYVHGHFRERSGQYLLVRYEDLVTRPEQELERACAFLGVPFSAEMLEADRRRHPRYRDMPFHENLSQPISTAGIGRYKATAASLRSSQETQAGEALRVFGYL